MLPRGTDIDGARRKVLKIFVIPVGEVGVAEFGKGDCSGTAPVTGATTNVGLSARNSGRWVPREGVIGNEGSLASDEVLSGSRPGGRIGVE